ncbi:MAG: hypothetical protein JW761_00400 [Prolixibacteraceae bacterium]|nr:hypothetical protein [Prolixibacteraceae bacterium]
MKEIIDFINRQFNYNQNKNLYYSGIHSSMHFAPELSSVLKKMNSLNPEDEKRIVDYTTEKALEEFCRVNQYYSFTQKDKLELKNIYSQLFTVLKQTSAKDKKQLQIISQNHISALKNWLLKSNAFSSKVYHIENELAENVACSEYSAELQLRVLNIRLSGLMEPVLDIGCGKQALLVNYLRRKGMEAFGTDRFESQNQFCQPTNWLEFDYGNNRWGTIISHLGFSNHFNHHHLRIDGNFREYALAYMHILQSLKPGGAFFYTPDLPFIEKYLDPAVYSVEKTASGKEDFKSAKITRLPTDI